MAAATFEKKIGKEWCPSLIEDNQGLFKIHSLQIASSQSIST